MIMEVLVIYLVGFVLAAIIYFIYHMYFADNKTYSKKHWLIESLKYGLWSWLYIFICLILSVVLILSYIDDYVNKNN